MLTRRQIDARYATLFYGQLSADGKLTFCNAGHNPPLIYGVDGLRRIEIGRHAGRPVRDGAVLRATRSSMKPGDTLVLYSDGVTEAHNVAGEEFGEERLVAGDGALHQRAAPTSCSSSSSTPSRTFARGAEQYDDVTALVVKYTGPK